MGKKSTTETIEREQLPTSWDDFAELQEVDERAWAARARRDEIDERARELRGRLEGTADEADLDALARQSLGGESVATLAPDVEKLETELKSLEHQLRIAQRAVDLVENERKQLRERLLEDLVPEARAEYIKIVESTADTLLALGELVERESEFRNAYNGYQLRLFPVKIQPANLRIDRGRMQHWLEEAVEYGFLDSSYLERFNANYQEAPSAY